MNNFRTHKIIAFFLAVLMILPLIPAVDLTVFAEGSDYDFSGDVGKKANFNQYFPVPIYHEKPININNNPLYSNDCYQLGYNDFMPPVPSPTDEENSEETYVPQSGTIDDVQAAMAKVTMIIDDWYYNEEADLLWYKVKVIEGDTIQKLEENPWVFHDKVKNSVGENSLVLGEKYDILQNAEFVNRTGYFVKNTIRLYNTAFEVYEYMPTSTEVYVAYSFTYMNEWYYWLAGDGFDGGRFCIVKAEDVSFIFNSIINTKVIIKPSVTSVNVYADPKTDISAYLTLDAALFDGVYKVTDTYYSVSENILFYGLAPCERMIWPEETNGYRYVSSEIVEETDQGIAFPIVDFCNPAPIMSYNSQIQPRSAIYGARSAIARASLYSTDSLLSTAAEGTSSSDSLKLSKDVRNNGDGTYTITLDAYTTGTVTVTQTTVPMDIVLVLDQSGSMEYCIGCNRTSVSSNSTHTETTYTVAQNVSTNGTYYRKNGSNYTRVYYCSSCNAWLDTNQNHYWHQNSQKYYSDSTTFYTATTQTVRCQSRLDALKTAVTNFVDEVNKKAKGANGEYGGGDDVNHRIAIVGFANYSNYQDYNNTEVFVGATGYKYGTAAQGVYSTALQDMSTESGYNNVIASKNALDANGATYVDLGIEMANGIFAANPITTAGTRNRIMIVFTDGVPGYAGDWGSDSYGSTGDNAYAVANEAIGKAYITKNTYGATVYTVGVFDGADASNPTTLPNTDNDNNRSNRYMHLTSSNWPTATSMTVTGKINENVTATQSYYMSASSTEALNNIFVTMSNQVGGTPLPLDSTTVVKDIITPQFTLPANASDVQVYSEKCKAYNEQTDTPTWGGEVEFLNSNDVVTIDTVNHCVDVTGFDFAHNYVAQNGRVEGDDTKEGDFHGRKLVIVFTIAPDPDFLGGDGVATNGTQSGIYSKGEPIAFFPPRSVSVPLKDISTIVKNKHIYYGNTTDLTGILDLWAISRADQNKALPVDVDGINNAYVNLLYTIKLNDSTVAQYYVPAGEPWGSENCTWRSTAQTQLLQNYQALEDTGFSVECSMISAANTGNVKSTTGSATVYVYKPTLEFKDSEQKYKAALNPASGFLESHFVGATWSHPNQNGTIEGTAPTFTFVFDHAAGAFDNGIMNSVRDVPVNVTVTINGTGTAITNNQGVTFTHSTCNHAGCDFDPDTEEFIVHVIGALTSLKIQKVTKDQNGKIVSFENIDPNQTFLFRVMGKDADGQDIDVTVTVHAKDGSTIVDGLVIGNQYTVQELTNWSWRYTCELGAYTNGDGAQTDNTFTKDTATLTITSLGELNNVATFENTRNTEYWLDGDSWCDNRFMSNVSQAIN